MIISASRRSDIPAFYLDWFLGRLREGYVLSRNPMNPRQVSRINLEADAVDCIVFWSKNPAPLLERLEAFAPIPYYVQFTINPYGPELEGNLPDKETLVGTFRRLADALGPERVVWRYSPVIIHEKYGEAFHLDFFARLAEKLRGFTMKCNLGFLDIYAKIKKNMARLGIVDTPEEVKTRMAAEMSRIAAGEGMALGACGNIDLDAANIPPARCIDAALIERLIGRPLRAKKDPGQRNDCYCTLSADVGSYNTCPHECRYCYANYSPDTARKRLARHDTASPMLCDALRPDDVVTDRKDPSKRKGGHMPTLF
jgi:Domain of unknown function (DUF1848).